MMRWSFEAYNLQLEIQRDDSWQSKKVKILGMMKMYVLVAECKETAVQRF
jgi:hypothetical protein